MDRVVQAEKSTMKGVVSRVWNILKSNLAWKDLMSLGDTMDYVAFDCVNVGYLEEK